MRSARIFLTLSFLVAVPASAQSVRPSFDCTKARLPDEKAICSDEKLSQLDQTIALALSQVGKDQAKFAREDAHDSLMDRHACGSNKVCILDNQADFDFHFEGLWSEGFRPALDRIISPDALERERSAVRERSTDQRRELHENQDCQNHNAIWRSAEAAGTK